ncbi:MAG: glycosyltransferase [Bauldia sp.]|nr:glycosyltransferase [Bauldia sp.]
MEAQQPRRSVAIVIPCFNSEATIGEAIDSALLQDRVAEIVVVDDGSTDGSAAIASGYGDRVRVLTGANAGVSIARNRGIDATTAPLIQFLDADDILKPGTMALRVDALVSSGADAVVTDWQQFRDEGGVRVAEPPRSAPFDDLARDAELSCMTRFWAPPAAILYRRSIVERAGRYRADHKTLDDARFLFDVARAGAAFRHEAHPGALYRVHAGSKSRSDPTAFWLTALRKAVEVEALWRSEGAFTDVRRERLADVYNGAAWGLFQAASGEYPVALRAADGRGVRLTPKNRIARTLVRVLGIDAALGLTRVYARSRRHLRGSGPGEGMSPR